MLTSSIRDSTQPVCPCGPRTNHQSSMGGPAGTDGGALISGFSFFFVATAFLVTVGSGTGTACGGIGLGVEARFSNSTCEFSGSTYRCSDLRPGVMCTFD